MVAAASLFVTSSVAHAQNITKANAANAGTITVDGNVTNVTPDRTVNGGNTAINQFAKFELDKGNIANLQFEKAGTLVNFVDSKASINAPGGINLAAQNVKIESGAKLLNTNTIDFSNLVNTVDVEGVEVSAGLDSNLTLTTDENGGIYISARVDDNTITAKTNIADVIGFGIDKVEDPLTASITVGEDAEITSDADVTLRSLVTSNRSTQNKTDTLSNFYGFKSELDVAGKIKAKNINLESKIIDNYNRESSVNGDTDIDFNMVFDVFSMMNASKLLQNFGNIANGYVFRGDEATLNIAKTATLDAAKNIDVDQPRESQFRPKQQYRHFARAQSRVHYKQFVVYHCRFGGYQCGRQAQCFVPRQNACERENGYATRG